MKLLFTLLLTPLTIILLGQGCTITESNLVELSGDDGFGNCTYSIDLLFIEGSGPDNGTLTFTSSSATILSGAGPHSCTCSGNTYTITFQAVCGSTVSFTAIHDNSGNGNDCSVDITNIVLAVDWLDFRIKKENDNVAFLQWSTDSEVNNERFEIEYSKDGKVYNTVGSVPGSGTAYQPTHYEYRHRPNGNGVVYYRIKQIDFDGQFSYSEIRHLSLTDKMYSIFPNPTKGSIYISTPEDDTSTIHVFDSSGRKIFTTSKNQIDLGSWSNGLYTLQIINSDLNSFETQIHRVILSK